MKRKFFLSGTAIIAVAAAAAGSAFILNADDGNSQTFHTDRFALIAAEADAAIPAAGNSCDTTRKVILRINTVTGTTDILQFAVAANDDPSVTSASWARVSNNNSAFNSGSGF